MPAVRRGRAVKDVRVAASPSAQEALSWLSAGPSGALSLVVTRAKGTAVRCDPTPEALRLLGEAADRALQAGAARVLAWHAEGVVPVGAPVAIVGACAEHRKEALRAVDVLLAGLKGVAARTDLPP